MLGLAALVIDMGGWYQGKRRLQGSADATALAASAYLSVGWSSATTAAAHEFALNQKSGDSASYQQTTAFVANDSITVTVTRQSPSFFAQVFGKGNVTVTATARATREMNSAGLMPWGVMKNTYTPGQSYAIYTDQSSPNNGALRLDVWNGSSCGVNLGGAADYRADILNQNLVCPASVGTLIDPKTGQNTGPTAQGIDGRITSFDPVSSIATFNGNGTVNLLKPTSPQLVLVPIIENAQTGTNVWPNGSGQVRIVSFAWFVITGYTNGGKTVNGTFLATANTDPNATSNGTPLAYQAALTS